MDGVYLTQTHPLKGYDAIHLAAALEVQRRATAQELSVVFVSGDQRGLVASVDGRQVVRGQKTGHPGQAEELGKALAEELLAQGARELLNP